MNILNGLNDKKKLEAVEVILAKYRERTAVDRKFYNKKSEVQAVVDELFDKIETSDPYLEALIKMEAGGPFTIFSYLLHENFSDIMIHRGGYMVSDVEEIIRTEVPPHLFDLYEKFVNHFIDNIMFVSEKKFDTGNPILDAEIGLFRFNLIHSSLLTGKFPIIVVRKQTISKTLNFDPEKYLKSIEVSPTQAEAIHRYAYQGNCIVFGEVGSGKTTLLKYMGNHRLEEKRNLCTIEDTSELKIDVPISLITNSHKGIKELFTASLRQNPSHVIIGETRTDEIVDILESALTISVLTTIHANSFRRAIERIVFMSIKRDINPEDMRNLINSAVDCFIFMDERKVKEIWEHVPEQVSGSVYDAYRKI
jgi:type IV secretory pathway ATPase VirB11/archaellum biosynthesis ATPase